MLFIVPYFFRKIVRIERFALRAAILVDSDPRWPPLTQSLRSRRSYGNIEDCEQSIIIVIVPC